MTVEHFGLNHETSDLATVLMQKQIQNELGQNFEFDELDELILGIGGDIE